MSDPQVAVRGIFRRRSAAIVDLWSPVVGPRAAREVAEARQWEPLTLVAGALALSNLVSPATDGTEWSWLAASLALAVVIAVFALRPGWKLQREFGNRLVRGGVPLRQLPPVQGIGRFERWLFIYELDRDRARALLSQEQVPEVDGSTSAVPLVYTPWPTLHARALAITTFVSMVVGLVVIDARAEFTPIWWVGLAVIVAVVGWMLVWACLERRGF